ncbi:Agenet-like domain [Sesbania bispinosa]|nr:Agenet-like domain [Sesbania bispinosa]
MEDEEGTKRLRESLNLHQLRPIPPPDTNLEFKFGQEVDAFHHDGWWEGHIAEELGNGRFAVFFRVSKEQINFSKEDLRENELEETLLTPNVKPVETGAEKKEEFSVGALVEVSSDDDGFRGAWFSATIVEARGKEKFLVEYHSLLADDGSSL